MSLRRLALGTRTGQSEQRQVYQPDKQKPLFYSVRYLIVSSLPLSSMGAARFQNPLQDRRDGMDRHAKFPKGIRRNTNIIALSISIGLAYSMCCTSRSQSSGSSDGVLALRFRIAMIHLLLVVAL